MTEQRTRDAAIEESEASRSPASRELGLGSSRVLSGPLGSSRVLSGPLGSSRVLASRSPGSQVVSEDERRSTSQMLEGQ